MKKLLEGLHEQLRASQGLNKILGNAVDESKTSISTLEHRVEEQSNQIIQSNEEIQKLHETIATLKKKHVEECRAAQSKVDQLNLQIVQEQYIAKRTTANKPGALNR